MTIEINYKDKFSDRFPRYNALEMEAALCMWEHMTENRESEQFARGFDWVGSPGMRHVAIAAGKITLAVFYEMEKADHEICGGSYDFDFVPAVADLIDWPKLVEADQYKGPAYEPDAAAMFATILADNPALFGEDEASKARAKASWYEQARRASVKLWAYVELVADHEERFESYRLAGQSAEEAAREIGEKYELTPVTEKGGL